MESREYWEKRYERGGTSGQGSYGRLADFKAGVINHHIKHYEIKSVVDFGCGDGNMTGLIEVDSYVGVDISKTAVSNCSQKYSKKEFFHFDDFENEAELSLSLDVIFHLVEDKTFEEYMKKLFDSATRFVIIYSSNKRGGFKENSQVRHRLFTEWVERKRPDFKFFGKIDNQYPITDRKEPESFSDFYIYEKI